MSYDGLTVQELFAARHGTGLTFDDIIILPRYVEAPPAKVSLTARFGLFDLINPIISSPMDRVTEWETAVHMALNGCLGILHINLTPDEAVEQVRRVKRYQMGFIWEPICRRPDQTVAEAKGVKRTHGFSTLLVTEDGTPRSSFVGLVTGSCFSMETDDSRPLSEVMMRSSDIVVASKKDVSTLDEARQIFRRHPLVTKLPILNEDGSVHAFVTRSDLEQRDKCPTPLVNENCQLRVGSAVTTHPEDDALIPRLIDAGVDCIVIDSSQGATGYAVKRIEQIVRTGAPVTVVAGNVVTARQALYLLHAGAHVIRVGMGPGSICTTQGAIGVGRAQASAIRAISGQEIPHPCAIADGGIREVGDMIKALALGASSVMLGRFIAGCDETPAPEIEYGGRKYKMYRGMGSLGAMRVRGKLRYGGDADDPNAEMVAQGVDDQPIPAIGPLDRVLRQTLAGIRKALQTLGCASIEELQQAVRDGEIRFELRSEAAKIEGKPHDLLTLPTK